MTGLKYKGYTEATIQKRRMVFGELRHRFASFYLEHPNHKIIILDLDDGARVEINSMKEALEIPWCDECWIELIGLPHLWGTLDDEGNVERDDASTVFIIQMSIDEANGCTSTIL